MMKDSLKGNFACNLTYWLIGLVSVTLMVIYSMRIKAEQEERKKLKAFMNFLDMVSYQYTIFQSVEEAVFEAMDQMDKMLENIVEEIYRILMQEDQNELFLYKKEVINSYYYQFIVFSYLTMEYGDDIEHSHYRENLSFLKQQIFLWLLDREQLSHYFAGLAFVILLPVQFLKAIKLWADYNLPELERYYQGEYGNISRFLLLLLTVLCYQVLMLLWSENKVSFHTHDIMKEISEQKYIKQYYDFWMEHHPKKVKQLSELLRRSSARISLKEFCLIRDCINGLTMFISFVFLAPVCALSGFYFFVSVLLLFSLLVITYYLPEIYLIIRIRLMFKEKEDESYFFYAITQIFASVGKGDAADVLEWLEAGSIIFTPTIQNCMDEFAFDNESALDKAKMDEPFPPFMKLMDALKLSEQVGMVQAVRPLGMEVKHFLEKRKQDNWISTGNKGVLGKFVAFIPMMCTIGIYLIIPFVLESLTQLREYLEQLQTGF